MKDRNRGVRRRVVISAAAAAPLAALAPASAQTPPADDLLEAARAQTKQNIAQLRRTRVPVLQEPTFIFRP